MAIYYGNDHDNGGDYLLAVCAVLLGIAAAFRLIAAWIDWYPFIR